MISGNAETELGQANFDRVSVMISQFMLGWGWRFAANELRNLANGPYDLLYAKIPNWLGFLYPLFRAALWIKRLGRLRPLPRPQKTAQE